MMTRSSPPATKTDLDELRRDLTAEIRQIRSVMSTKDDIAGMATKDDIVKILGRKVDNLIIDVIKLREGYHEIRTTMATKNDINRILNAIDAFAGKSEDSHRAILLHGQILTEIQITLKDHGRRLTALESRPSA